MGHPGNGDRWLGGPVLAIWTCCRRLVIVDAVPLGRGSEADGMSAQAKLTCTVGWIVRADHRPSHVHVWWVHRPSLASADPLFGMFAWISHDFCRGMGPGIRHLGMDVEHAQAGFYKRPGS